MFISGFEKIHHLTHFELIETEGEHTSCTFTAEILATDGDIFLAREGEAITVQLEKGRTIFYGLVREVLIEQTFNETLLKVKAKSYTILADEQPNLRIFQNPAQSNGEILKSIDWKKYHCTLQMDEKFSSAKAKGIDLLGKPTALIMQGRETDFALLKRLARNEQMGVWIINTHEGKTIIEIAPHTGNYNIKKHNILHLQQIRSQKMTKICAELSSEADLGIGTKAKIGDLTTPCTVIQKNFIWSYGELGWHYKFSEKPMERYLLNSSPPLKTFLAEVTDVNDKMHLGRVQVKFLPPTEDCVKDTSKRLWLPYRTPYSGKKGATGIVFLPDVGDLVEVHFADTIYASCTFRETALLEECQNTTEKYIGNNSQQRIFWKENSLELASSDNRIVMDKEKIEMLIGNSSTRLCLEKDTLSLKTADSEIILSPDGIAINSQKEIKVNANSALHIAGKSITSTASGKNQISGSSVQICP